MDAVLKRTFLQGGLVDALTASEATISLETLARIYMAPSRANAKTKTPLTRSAAANRKKSFFFCGIFQNFLYSLRKFNVRTTIYMQVIKCEKNSLGNDEGSTDHHQQQQYKVYIVEYKSHKKMYTYKHLLKE